MTCTYKKVNKLAELNLLHDILNYHKQTNNLNSHYYPIIQWCMNICKGKEKFNEFRILLDSWCISTVIMGGIIKNSTKISCDAM